MGAVKLERKKQIKSEYVCRVCRREAMIIVSIGRQKATRWGYDKNGSGGKYTTLGYGNYVYRIFWCKWCHSMFRQTKHSTHQILRRGFVMKPTIKRCKNMMKKYGNFKEAQEFEENSVPASVP